MKELKESLRFIRERFGPGHRTSVHTKKGSPSDVSDLTLAEFRKSRLVVRIRSRLLGEDILLVPSCTHRSQCEPGCVVYVVDELAALCDLTPSHIRRVHYLKKICDGEIVTTLVLGLLSESDRAIPDSVSSLAMGPYSYSEGIPG